MAKTLTFSYTGFTYKQNPKAPDLFAFVASANELAKFCGVARKSEHFLQNYQRALDSDRVKKQVTPFFKMPENCSPTAIVLSLHDTPLAKIDFEEVKIDGSSLRPKVLKITMTDPASLSDEEVIDLSKQFLDQRLASGDGGTTSTTTQTASGGDSDSDAGKEGDDGEGNEDAAETEGAEDENGSEEEEDTEGVVEIGQSKLRELRSLLDDASKVTPEMIENLKETLLPALVIDGQHRLFGAARVEEEIPFLVCSLVKPDWKEQVFQFTVINDKAHGIPKPFITSLAGMSLTAQELSDLRTRLSQAGVQLWEVNVMQKMGYDPTSPFFNLIEFKVTGSGSDGLGYQTMKRVGKAWYDPKHQGLISLMRILYTNPSDAKKSTKTLKGAWQDDARSDWFMYFVTFWSEVKKRLGTSALWKLHSSLLTAVVLEQFQDTFLTYLDSVSGLTIDRIDEEDPNVRRQQVETAFAAILTEFLSKFEPKHFAKPWAIKSLNHRDGKDQLSDYFDKIFKGTQVHRHPLVAASNP
jgi:hypothetical protein